MLFLSRFSDSFFYSEPLMCNIMSRDQNTIQTVQQCNKTHSEHFSNLNPQYLNLVMVSMFALHYKSGSSLLLQANPILFHPSVFPSSDPPLVPPAQLVTLLANPSEDLECSGSFRLTVDLPNAWMEVRRLEGRGERSKVSPGG